MASWPPRLLVYAASLKRTDIQGFKANGYLLTITAFTAMILIKYFLIIINCAAEFYISYCKGGLFIVLKK